MVWIIAAVVAIVLVLAVVAIARQRSTRLRDRFGPEYDHLVAQTGRKQTETELATRQKRVESFNLRELTPGARDRYVKEWQLVQARFVDDPNSAIADADRLVLNVMQDRGYPMQDFESRARDLSVDHADEVLHYRAAHEISVKNESSVASTEEIRQAIVHYRALFEHLLGVDRADANARFAS